MQFTPGTWLVIGAALGSNFVRERKGVPVAIEAVAHTSSTEVSEDLRMAPSIRIRGFWLKVRWYLLHELKS